MLLYPRNTVGPSPPVQSADSAPRPPLLRSQIGQYLEGHSHNSELLLGPVNTWRHALGTFPLEGLLVCSNYLTNRTLNQEPATHLAPWLGVKVDVFPKMHPSHCAPNAWTSKATTKKPYQKLERLEGCWCWVLQNVLEGGIPARPWSWKALVDGEVDNVPSASKGAGCIEYVARTMCGTVQ